MSYRTWPIRSVQVQLSHPVSEPPLIAASGSQKYPEHRREELNTPRTIPLTMETLAAHGEDSLQRLRRCVKASIAPSACPASSSSKLGVGPEGFIVISTLCVCCASPAACCWCRVSCCLFLMSKMFYLLKYNQSRITQARDKQVEEDQDQSMKGCSVNSERCKNIHRNCNSRQIGSHIHKDS